MVAEPYQINSPGKYCLATDLSGVEASIFINSDDVELNLNGHSLKPSGDFNNAVAINNGLKNIIVKNGFLVGDGSNANGVRFGNSCSAIVIENISSSGFGTTNFGGHGIFISGQPSCKDIVIKDSFIFGNYMNMEAQACDNMTITNCSFNLSTTNVVNNSCVLNSCNNVYIQGCSFNENQGNGLVFGGDVGRLATYGNGLVENSSFNGNSAYGFLMATSGKSGINVSFNRCSFNSNTDGGVFISEDAQSIKFENCTFNSTGNGNGIHITDNGPVNTKLVNCEANNNFNNGFMLEGNNMVIVGCSAEGNIIGFSIGANGSGLIKGCIAINNNNCGFDTTSVSSVNFVSNTGESNGSNPSDKRRLGTDTNYCENNNPTNFTNPSPAITGIYKQSNPAGSNPNYWNNVTLQ